MPRHISKTAFVAALLLTFWPVVSNAQIVINEIMYDLSGSDTDREWVEIYNSGPEPVSMVVGSGNGSWRFVDNSPHVINLYSSDGVIPAGGFAIIAKNASQFLNDWPAYAGILFTSAISLPNTGATLSVKDGTGTVLDQVVYSSD